MIARAAVISACGRYRPKLERRIGPGLTALWIGVNPSTADADDDDHSIRKLYGFGDHLGIGRWLVGNKFDYRATDVTALKVAAQPVSAQCDVAIEQMMREADLVIAGWGALAKLPPHLRERWRVICSIADRLDIPLWCWGTNQDGQPRHPLMLGYDTRLVIWRDTASNRLADVLR